MMERLQKMDQPLAETTGTVKVSRDSGADDTVRPSQTMGFRNAGWDFSIGGSNSSGTVRSVVRPPQVRDRKAEVVPLNSQSTAPRKNLDSGNQRSSATGTVVLSSSEVSMKKDANRGKSENHQAAEDVSGMGTMIVRSPRGFQASPAFSNQSSTSSTTYGSTEDASISGTIVYRGTDDSDYSPRTPKSRLGLQERSFSAALENSEMNLAEANAAIHGGKKGNGRERSALNKVNRDVQASRNTEQPSTGSDSLRHSSDYSDAQRAFSRSRNSSDDDDSAISSAAALAAPLSFLLIPSLKEAIDDSGGLIYQKVVNSLIDMERAKPGSSELLVTNLLQKLASSKEDSLKDLQELADQIFVKGKIETPSPSLADPDIKKNQQTKDFHSNANMSPLARFLLSRWEGLASRDLNSS